MGVSQGGCCGAPDRPPAPCPTQLHPWESHRAPAAPSQESASTSSGRLTNASSPIATRSARRGASGTGARYTKTSSGPSRRPSQCDSAATTRPTLRRRRSCCLFRSSRLPTNSLQQAQRRYTSGVHHRNWLALAEAFVSEASRRGGRYKTGALTQVHHWSRLSDSREDGEALSSVHSTGPPSPLKKENRHRKGGMGGRHAATTQGFQGEKCGASRRPPSGVSCSADPDRRRCT